MVKRKIQPSDVINIVQHPVISWRNRTGNLLMYEGHVNERKIIVAVDARNPRWVVGVSERK
jgi:hypothetical protein